MKDNMKSNSNELINGITSLLKAESINPHNEKEVIRSLKQCVSAKKLISFYYKNKERICEMQYTYEK